MSDRELKMKILFAMVEKITAPLKRIQVGTKASAESVKNLRQKIGDLNEQQSNINGFKKLHDTLRETSEKLVGAELRAAQLKTQIESSVEPNKTLWREYDRAQNKVKILTNALHTEGEQLDNIQTKLQRAGIRTERLGDHEKELQANVAKTNRELAEQRSQLDALTAKTHKATKAKQLYQRTQAMAGKIAMTGAGMGAAGAVAAAGLKVPVTAYAAAEDSKMQLKVSMMQQGGKVSAEFEKINALAMKLGDKLPGTTSDYLDMMTMLQRQGLSANNVLGGTGEATALLAVQLKKLPSEAAEFAAKMQDATGTTEADMLKLMDVIQRTYYLGVDDNDMLQAITKMSPAMKTLRKSGLEAVNALAPLMVMFDQAGMKGEAGGNAVRKVLDLSMDKKKRDKVNKELKPHGINLNFTDGKGEFAGMDHMFAQFQKLKKLNRETTLAALKEQFGDDAETQQVLTILIDKGKAGYEEVIGKMKAQADLQTRVNAQLGTLKNLWEAASGTFTNAMVAFGDSISPELKALTNWIGETSGEVGAWARENPKLSSTLMKIAAIIAIVLVVVGGLMLALSAVLMPLAVMRLALAGVGIQSGAMATGMKMLRVVMSGLGTVIGFISQAFLRMGLAMLANPIGLLIVAIVAIAAAAYLIYEYWEPIKDFFKGIWDKVTAFFSSGIGNISAQIINWSPLGLMYKSFAGVMNFFGVKMPADLSSMFKQTWEKLSTFSRSGIANISAQILNWSPLGLMYKAFAGVMNFFGVTMPADLSSMFQQTWERLRAFANSGIDNIAKTILAFSPVGIFMQVFGAVFTYFGELTIRFKGFAGDIIDGLIQGLKDKAGALKDAVVETAGSIGNWFAEKMGIHSPSRVFMRFGGDTVDGYTQGIKKKDSEPLDMLSGMAKRLAQMGGSLGAGLALSLGTANATQLAPIQAQIEPLKLENWNPVPTQPANTLTAPAAPGAVSKTEVANVQNTSTYNTQVNKLKQVLGASIAMQLEPIQAKVEPLKLENWKPVLAQPANVQSAPSAPGAVSKTDVANIQNTSTSNTQVNKLKQVLGASIAMQLAPIQAKVEPLKLENWKPVLAQPANVQNAPSAPGAVSKTDVANIQNTSTSNTQVNKLKQVLGASIAMQLAPIQAQVEPLKLENWNPVLMQPANTLTAPAAPGALSKTDVANVQNTSTYNTQINKLKQVLGASIAMQLAPIQAQVAPLKLENWNPVPTQPANTLSAPTVPGAVSKTDVANVQNTSTSNTSTYNAQVNKLKHVLGASVAKQLAPIQAKVEPLKLENWNPVPMQPANTLSALAAPGAVSKTDVANVQNTSTYNTQVNKLKQVLGASIAMQLAPIQAKVEPLKLENWNPALMQKAVAPASETQTDPIRFDQRKPLASSTQPSMMAAPTTIQITINPTPGMDPQAIARAVAAELDKRERQQVARSRSSLHDNSSY